MQTARHVILALSLATVILCSWLKPLDSTAVQQIDTGLKRALVSFATARTLNAVISVAQGTELSVQPLGFGVNFTPGQLLDPINDLVEQFSNLMLAACVAFGIQKMLVGIGGYWMISLLLSFIAFSWGLIYFRQQYPPEWLSKMLVILLMLRFALPVVTIGTDMLFEKFMAADYETNLKAIDTASAQTAQINPPVNITSENQEWLEKIKNWGAQNMDVKARFETLRRAAEKATEHIIKLIVIFLLQTLVIPLLLLWTMYAVAKGAFELPKQMSKVTAK